MAEAIKTTIAEDTKAAMRARDKERLGVLRMINAGIKQVEVDTREALDDEAVIEVLERMIKQRREARQLYQSAGETGRAAQEDFEIEVIQTYMPQALSDEEIEALVAEAVAQEGARTVKDMGRVMAALKPRLKGRADMRSVSEKVKRRLA